MVSSVGAGVAVDTEVFVMGCYSLLWAVVVGGLVVAYRERS